MKHGIQIGDVVQWIGISYNDIHLVSRFRDNGDIEIHSNVDGISYTHRDNIKQLKIISRSLSNDIVDNNPFKQIHFNDSVVNVTAQPIVWGLGVE